MRYEILLEQGGFLPEADSICLRNVDELFVLPSLYTAYEHETKRPGFVSLFYASSPGHCFLAQILDELSQLQPESLLTPFMSVGNRALRDFIKKWGPNARRLPQLLDREQSGRLRTAVLHHLTANLTSTAGSGVRRSSSAMRCLGRPLQREETLRTCMARCQSSSSDTSGLNASGSRSTEKRSITSNTSPIAVSIDAWSPIAAKVTPSDV